MIKLLRNNEHLKIYIQTIYNEFRNKNSFPYETAVDWFNNDIVHIASPEVKTEMEKITETIEKLIYA